MACSRWAFLTSGFWFRLAIIFSSVAPWIARWNFTFLLVRFLETSSTDPFLCFLLYSTVHETLRGFRFIRNERSLFLSRKLKHYNLKNVAKHPICKPESSSTEWTIISLSFPLFSQDILKQCRYNQRFNHHREIALKGICIKAWRSWFKGWKLSLHITSFIHIYLAIESDISFPMTWVYFVPTVIAHL